MRDECGCVKIHHSYLIIHRSILSSHQMIKMKNRILPLITAGFFVIATLAASFPTEHHFKNLKVLPKDISEEALDSIMDNFNYALGVRCNFCHARNDSTKHLDFPSDAKGEKGIARGMMLMTANINKKYFNFNKEKIVPQTVTCITCHRKNAMPPTDTMPVRKH